MSSFSYWSIDAHLETAKQLYMAGYSGSQVAAELARRFPDHKAPSRNAVIGLVYRLGLTRDDRKQATSRLVHPRSSKREKPPTNATLKARERAMNPASVPASPPKPVLLTGLEKVWTERKRFECTWIVAGEGADSIACCAPTGGPSWCAHHRSIGLQASEPPEPTRKRTRREPTFYDLEAA